MLNIIRKILFDSQICDDVVSKIPSDVAKIIIGYLAPSDESLQGYLLSSKLLRNHFLSSADLRSVKVVDKLVFIYKGIY